MSKVVYKAIVRTARIFTLEKQNVDCMTEKQNILKGSQVPVTGHNLKWDHFEELAKGRSDTQGKIKETLLIQELPYPTLSDNVNSEKL